MPLAKLEKSLAAGDSPGEKAFVAIAIPSPIASGWPASQPDPHITVLYVGGPITPERKAVLIGVMKDACLLSPPLRLTFAPGVSWFANDKGEEIAHKAFDGPSQAALKRFHLALRSAAEKAGFVLRHGAGFIAHATLAYCGSARVYAGPVPEGGFVAVTAELLGWPEPIVLALGGERAGEVPLAKSLMIDAMIQANAFENLPTQGQVPGWNPPASPPARPIMLEPAVARTPDDIVRGLGLEPGVASGIMLAARRAAGAAMNEQPFRVVMATHLLTSPLGPSERKIAMSRAVDYFHQRAAAPDAPRIHPAMFLRKSMDFPPAAREGKDSDVRLELDRKVLT